MAQTKRVELPVLRSVVPSAYRNLVDKAEADSVKAAIALKCAARAAWALAEVKNCHITACALWHLRRVARPERVLTDEQREALRERRAKQGAATTG